MYTQSFLKSLTFVLFASCLVCFMIKQPLQSTCQVMFLLVEFASNLFYEIIIVLQLR